MGCAINISEWYKFIRQEEELLDFKDGFKFLYCPAETISRAEVAFISLNPGRPPDQVSMREITDERGNTYEVESTYTKSPITKQFLALSNFINKKPSQILTGVAFPFRSNRWKDLTNTQKSRGLELGKMFWLDMLSKSNLKLLILCAEEVKIIFNKDLDMKIDCEISANWSNIKLRRYTTNRRLEVIQLPHLSTYKLFSRPESESALKEIFSNYFNS